MQDLQKGTELANRYTLVRKLGGGGDTETWLASDRMTRASVALKVLSSERTSAAALRKEWQTSIRLMHAHIARVFEFHDDPDATFYSLQFVDGSDISVLSGAPLDHILRPIALVADALRYAHGKSVVHRDIKASNILLDQNGAPYLSDFGVAAAAGVAADGGSLIAASPQSLAGEPPSPSDDVFALGGLVYELIAGRSPYSSDATEADIRDAVAAPLRAADGTTVPQDVQQLVASMLEKDANRRPDAEAVRVALESAGYTAGPAPPGYVAGRHAAAEEVIEASDAVRHRPQSTAPALEESGHSGISPRTLGISLLVLLAVLIGVVFFLPKTVTTEQQAAVVEAGDNEIEASDNVPQRGQVEFTENVDNLKGRDERVVARAETESVLGELLSKMETLQSRAVQRWGGLRFKQAQAAYEEGDTAYLARDYATARDKYRKAIEMVEPLLDEVDQVFAATLADAQAALDAADTAEALRLYELAVAISPSHAVAQAGFSRAKNLDTVLSLTDQGLSFEKDLELEAARQNFARASEIDPEWSPARDGLIRVQETIRQMDFDQRMTEGLMALGDGHFAAARAAFRIAQTLMPESREPADGLLQVDQGIRLEEIAGLERRAQAQERNEQWDGAVQTYESILEIDGNLLFAQQGLGQARQMTALHQRIEGYIEKPDTLSAPSTMQSATRLVVDITRMPEIGPRLSGQRDELSRLLKRAATPLSVQLVSDNLTDVSIYKVGKLGAFATHEVSLRPGTYVAVGSRPGFRDVRLEFQVGPEIEPKPIIVRCEEAI